MITYQQVGQMFNDRSIYKADMLTLNECWQVLIEHPQYNDPRHNQWVSALALLIQSKQADAHHLAQTQQSDTHHRETKGDSSDIKKTLKKTHRIDIWVLIFSILAFVAAAISAVDVVVKWFSNKPSVAVSEQIRPTHNTIK